MSKQPKKTPAPEVNEEVKEEVKYESEPENESESDQDSEVEQEEVKVENKDKGLDEASLWHLLSGIFPRLVMIETKLNAMEVTLNSTKYLCEELKNKSDKPKQNKKLLKIDNNIEINSKSDIKLEELPELKRKKAINKSFKVIPNKTEAIKSNMKNRGRKPGKVPPKVKDNN